MRQGFSTSRSLTSAPKATILLLPSGLAIDKLYQKVLLPLGVAFWNVLVFDYMEGKRKVNRMSGRQKCPKIIENY